MGMYSDNVISNFRYNTFRPHQKEALESIAKHFDNGVQFVIAELPTGVGKSDIAMSLGLSTSELKEEASKASSYDDEFDEDDYEEEDKSTSIMLGGAHITTSQNTLIDQYVKDFAYMKEFQTIKGRRNYSCKTGPSEELADGTIVPSNCEENKFNCSLCKQGGCTYSEQKTKAKFSKVSMTNLTYHGLAMTNPTAWGLRDLTVFDEAHNLPGEILSLVSMSVSNISLKKMMMKAAITDTMFPDKIVSVDAFYRFVEFVSAEASIIARDLEEDLKTRGYGSKMEQDALAEAKSFVWKARKFTQSIAAGVTWIVDKEDSKYGTKLVARPLHSAFFAKNLFFKQSKQFLLQSATIIDPKTYAKELGITGMGMFVRKPSPFNLVDQRPFYTMDTAFVTKKNMDTALPKILAAVYEIMSKYPNQKGMVHTHSYAIHKYLAENLKDKRCVFAEVGKRQEAIDKHLLTNEPTVLFSPSMTEGFDGKGDLLRFQIIVKVPYPDLGDRRTVLRKEEDINWYYYQTMKVIMQAAGRGMRSEDDYCDTYMLDTCIHGFLKNYNPDQEFARTIKSSTLAKKHLASLV